jgi:uncharacterized membrane protein YraQ (UPF0718 family)
VLATLQLTLGQVAVTFAHNWPFLLLGVIVASSLKVYVDQQAIGRFFRSHGTSSVVIATLVAVATPLCSCGTMAVILGMMASSVPWAPIVAFMAASPLTSPEETVISAGLFGWPFALTLLGASVAIGLGAGAVTHVLESRGWLANQARMLPESSAVPQGRPSSGQPVARADATACCSSAPLPERPSEASCCAAVVLPEGTMEARCCPASVDAIALPRPLFLATREWLERLRLPALRDEILRSGARLLVMFGGFAFLGYLINNLIPSAWVSALFGRGNHLGVPLAALLGLPLYINSDASLPMVRAFVDSGAGAGAALAFTTTGAGTSLGAVAGALTIARWRVIAIVIAALLAAAVLTGYGFDLLFGSARVG